VKCHFGYWQIPDLGPPNSVLKNEADIEVGDGRFRRLRMPAAKLSLL
jgi:hypothetical protein